MVCAPLENLNDACVRNMPDDYCALYTICALGRHNDRCVLLTTTRTWQLQTQKFRNNYIPKLGSQDTGRDSNIAFCILFFLATREPLGAVRVEPLSPTLRSLGPVRPARLPLPSRESLLHPLVEWPWSLLLRIRSPLRTAPRSRPEESVPGHAPFRAIPVPILHRTLGQNKGVPARSRHALSECPPLWLYAPPVGRVRSQSRAPDNSGPPRGGGQPRGRSRTTSPHAPPKPTPQHPEVTPGGESVRPLP